MSTDYVDAGRTSQKRRTRQALIEAARLLVAEELSLSVEAVAERAGISRTTAYRYFRNQTELLVAAHPETAATSLLPAHPPKDPVARLNLVLTSFIRLILDTEPQQRAMLRMSLAREPVGDLPLRQGRAIAWIGEALEPLRPTLGGTTVDQLSFAIRSATGVEALVWLTEVAGLHREDAGKLMHWAGMALLHAAEVGHPPPERSLRGSRRRTVRAESPHPPDSDRRSPSLPESRP